MDFNLVVVAGRLAAVPELRTVADVTAVRFLVTVRAEHPTSRVDVLPVTLSNPTPDVVDRLGRPGDRVWVAGRVQRRFWTDVGERRNRLDIVAHQLEFPLPGRPTGRWLV